MTEETKITRACRRAAFTLIELLLVVMILGTLAAVVVVNFGGQGETAKINATRTSISAIKTAVEAYEVRAGKFPDSLDDLTTASDDSAALLKKDSLADSWGNAFSYKRVGKYEFEIRSAGPDGQLNSEDDITN